VTLRILPYYRQHFAQITTTGQLKAMLRDGPYAWPGGYPLFFVTSDGGALSFQTVQDELSRCFELFRLVFRFFDDLEALNDRAVEALKDDG